MIKMRWENLRKSYVRAHKEDIDGRNPIWYLYERMNFLKWHIKHKISNHDESNNKQSAEKTVSKKSENVSKTQSPFSKHENLPSELASLKNSESLPIPPLMHLQKKRVRSK